MLKNLKILDFSTMLPGPFATLMLADLGAEVLHVSRPASEMEGWVVDDYLQRNKKSITVDLRDETKKEKVKQLVTDYDILVEQFRPGVMKRLGLDYKSLQKINPKLIYCSITGFGQTGPYKDRPGHDINYLALSGLASYSGTKNGGPANNSTQIADIAGGSYQAATAILAAVLYREQTGKGQAIDVSMTDGAYVLNALSAPTYFVHDQEPEAEEAMLNGGSFYGFYETKDGRYFSVGSLEPDFRKQLCEALELDHLLQLSFSQDSEHITKFKNAIKRAFLLKTYDEWMDVFSNYEACVEPVLSFKEATEHSHIKERKLVVNVNTEDGKTQKQLACPIKFSAYEPSYRHAGLTRGANNDEFLV